MFLATIWWSLCFSSSILLLVLTPKSSLQHFVCPKYWIQDFEPPTYWIQDFRITKSWIYDFATLILYNSITMYLYEDNSNSSYPNYEAMFLQLQTDNKIKQGPGSCLDPGASKSHKRHTTQVAKNAVKCKYVGAAVQSFSMLSLLACFTKTDSICKVLCQGSERAENDLINVGIWKRRHSYPGCSLHEFYELCICQ